MNYQLEIFQRPKQSLNSMSEEKVEQALYLLADYIERLQKGVPIEKDVFIQLNKVLEV